LICEREHMFLSIFTSTPVNQCLSQGVVKMSVMKFISYKIHGSQEKLSRWRHKICTQLWHRFRWVRWRHRNQTMMKNNDYHQCNGNRLRSGNCSLRLTTHMSCNLQVVKQGRSRIKHHI
jgi:hypothetical protein